MEVVIFFTQCKKSMLLDPTSKEAMTLPVIPRIELYKEKLLKQTYWNTVDELLILVAQQMKRESKLQTVTFKSVCNCKEMDSFITINTDTDGDMLEDPHHGFFPQRLALLR